jgi:hypothetical protein
MPHSDPAWTPRRRLRSRRPGVAGVILLAAACLVALGLQVLALSPSTAASPFGVLHAAHRGALGKAGGAVPRGTSVFDDDVPGVRRLDPELLGALRRAAADAGREGIDVVVDSGWRSPAYQEHLFREAVRKYGSEAEAARWVARAGTSAHVTGDAVDVGPAGAATWLSAHGAAYGLCRIYANEPWHFERRPGAGVRGCLPLFADPTQDPRMRR